MLERPCLDERCTMRNSNGDSNHRINGDENEPSNEDLPEVPCDGEISREVSDESFSSLNNTKEGKNDDEKAPPYFPQAGDEAPIEPETFLVPIGPWATGRVTFNPKAGMTGIRPVADRYSITRFSPAQWRAHNQSFFGQSSTTARAQSIAKKSREERAQIYRETDAVQSDNRNRLSLRASVIYDWKTEVERVLNDMREEIEILESERRRVKQSLSVLTIPESIAGDFLQLRSCRLEPDLVRDTVEDELVKELALCAVLRENLVKTRARIESQLLELKSAKSTMEFDFTDKQDAYDIESACIGLNSDSPYIMLKPGVARVPSNQSTPAGYDNFTRDNINMAKSVLQKSVDLRSNLDAIYVKLTEDLRSQATKVDIALAEKIQLTEQICQQLEAELTRCLSELCSAEDLIEELRGSVKGVTEALKVAQTRLDNRLHRRNVENCRDVPQYGLIEEIKMLDGKVSAMKKHLIEAENIQAELVKGRSDLEYEIIVKKKSLYVDRDRGQLLRSFYPSAQELSGYT